ncbi:DNA methylase N-4/N-6 domain protein [Candidatus Moduliflexus flocculans]|uniref:DNA methylase N-4/N-6 domain protein n=1 Tax=Candidatus Moduliflexus flocculans TaxID=1499966 RepID=A0A0S6W5S7_9BACT|nr:DNA methylase N-4/N-6 domain protein [Candidatus Moduliflexus flocculans]
MANHKNTLYYGDNLKILREYLADDSVDLIYLDPPFNSNRNYNVLFKDESGADSAAQLMAFDDTWHWDNAAADTYHELIATAAPHIVGMIGAFYGFIGTNQMMAYLVMMTARLIELHRVLKPTGSLYLHCDPTASHYLKIVLDTIFGSQNFRNEIIWKRQSAHNDARKKYAVITDSIFYYVKSDKAPFDVVRKPLEDNYVESAYRHIDEDGRRYRLSDLRSPNPRPNLIYEYKGYKPHPNGWAVSREKMEQLDSENRLHLPKKQDGRIQLKRYLDENAGQAVPNLWDDILPLHGSATELLGYPTQKPVALLERIIAASSNEGDVVLDPFCGCGTAIHAAQKLKRRWLGIDITHLAIALQKYRLKDAFGLIEKDDYNVIGEPEDLQAAQQLALDDRYQFQWWALSLIQAQPLGGDTGKKHGKKGADKGIDGIISFVDDPKNKPKKLIVQVKSGKVKSGDLRDLVGAIDREHAAMGVFITLEEPTKEMLKEALSAGLYHSPNWNRDYPRLQILTIEALLAGAAVNMPPTAKTYKKAQKETIQDGEQQSFL